MKKSNFITAQSPSEQQAKTWWALITTLLIGGTLIGISVVQIQQLSTLWNAQTKYKILQQEITLLNSNCETKKQLQQDITMLHTTLDQVKKILIYNKQLLQLLTWLNINIHNHLENLTINTNGWHFTFTTDSIETIENSMNQLQQDIQMRNMYLDSLQQKDNQLSANLKGNWI